MHMAPNTTTGRHVNGVDEVRSLESYRTPLTSW